MITVNKNKQKQRILSTSIIKCTALNLSNYCQDGTEILIKLKYRAVLSCPLQQNIRNITQVTTLC